MDSRVLNFLKKERVCALTILLPDGTPHAAAMHFSHREEPLELFFSTENTSRKCQAVMKGGSVRAAVVAGLSEEGWITLQMEGEVQMISDPEERKAVEAIHYPKHPNAEKFKDDPETVFLKFVPGWWRYTDYNSKPPTIMGSDKD